jgi:glucose-6-phosphate isomerase
MKEGLMEHFTHNLDLVFEEAIGTGGLSVSQLQEAEKTVEGALRKLKSQAQDQTLALLSLPAKTDDLEAIETFAHLIRQAGTTDAVILGTGGSSLGGQTLAQLADYGVPGLGVLRQGLRLHFMDNLDPRTFETFLNVLPLASTRFIAISKSGGTGETLMQTIAVLQKLKAQNMAIDTHVFGLSEPQKEGAKRNGLRALLEPFCVKFLEHHTGVGGRYSVLTNVGLLPAALMGLDMKALRTGALAVLNETLKASHVKEAAPALGAALNLAAMSAHKPLHVMMAYGDRFGLLTKWWVQLWAESVGKEGKGSQPISALGPVDQHSQLQLYLAGPKDKLFTVITTDVEHTGAKMDADLAALAGEVDFAGKTIGDLVSVQGRATADTLAKNGCPTRRIHVPTLNATSLGALLMHFMLETILAGYALNIDPFDQPAVEEGKILAKAYLKQS